MKKCYKFVLFSLNDNYVVDEKKKEILVIKLKEDGKE